MKKLIFLLVVFALSSPVLAMDWGQIGYDAVVLRREMGKRDELETNKGKTKR